MRKTVKSLHDRAMRLAQDALVARERGQARKATRLSRRAYLLEQRAARMVPNVPESEPTRSILYLGAASLAMQAGKHAEALELIRDGLAGYPPPEIRQKLENLQRLVGSIPTANRRQNSR